MFTVNAIETKKDMSDIDTLIKQAKELGEKFNKFHSASTGRFSSGGGSGSGGSAGGSGGGGGSSTGKAHAPLSEPKTAGERKANHAEAEKRIGKKITNDTTLGEIRKGYGRNPTPFEWEYIHAH